MIGNEAQLRLAGFEKEGCRGDWKKDDGKKMTDIM